MKVPDTEEFLTQESVGQKLKLIGTFLAASIPILISAIGLYIQFTMKSPKIKSKTVLSYVSSEYKRDSLDTC